VVAGADEQEDRTMQALLRISLGAALLTVPCAGTALAELPVYYHVGSWDAFSGTGDDGKPVCGIGTNNPADGRNFSIRFEIGGADVSFQAKKPSWNIPGGTQVPLVMQNGPNPPWSEQGSGNGQMVEWSVDRGALQSFDAQFRSASWMTLSFPTGNEAPWTLSLAGSTAVSNAFGRCITDMTQRAGAQAPAGPTQPFAPASAAAAAQPAAPAAAQPAAPAATPPAAPAATQPVAPAPSR
jgi:hypothetical protein